MYYFGEIKIMLDIIIQHLCLCDLFNNIQLIMNDLLVNYVFFSLLEHRIRVQINEV